MVGFRLKGYLFVAGFATAMVVTAVLLFPSGRQMGILQMESYEYDSSLDRLLEMHKKDPQDVVTLKYLSKVYGIMGDPVNEILYLEKYIQLRPQDTATRFELAKIYLWNLRQKDAKLQYLEILKAQPGNLEVLRKLALSYSWEQDYDNAMSCYEKIRAQDKLILEDYQAIIRLHLGHTRLKEALAVHEEIRAKYPEKFGIDLFKSMADIHLWLQQRDQAIAVLLDMLKSNGNDINAKYAWVEWHISKGMNKDALPLLRQWLEEYPRNMNFKDLALSIYLEERMHKEAIAQLEDMLRVNPKNSQVSLQLFWILVEEKQHQKAYDLAATLEEKLKDSSGLWSTLGYIAMDLGLYSESHGFWQKELQRKPDSLEAHDGLFELYRIQKKEDLARDELEWLIRRKPDHPSYLEYQIQLHMQARKFKEALPLVTKAHALHPNNEYFMESLVACARELQEWDLALDACRKLKDNHPTEFSYTRDLVDILIAKLEYSEAILLLDEAFYLHGKDETTAYTIAEYMGWCQSPYRQLEILDDLEKRKDGWHFDDERLKVALENNFYTVSEEILKRRIAAGKDVADSFRKLFQIYGEWGQAKPRVDMLKDAMASEWLGRKIVLESIIDIELGEGKLLDALGHARELYDLDGRKEVLRARIIEICGWTGDAEIQLDCYEKYAKRKGAEGVKLAALLQAKSRDREAADILLALDPPHGETLEAVELLHYCAYGLKDEALIARTLDGLIQLEKRPDKRAVYLATRAANRYAKGLLNEAEADARGAYAIDPKSDQANLILGYVLYDRKQFQYAVEHLKKSQLRETYDKFLLAACLKRFHQGYRESLLRFDQLMRDFRQEESFKKWNLYLDIGYELNDETLVERSWTKIMEKYYKPELLPRYALHLLYTDRKPRAEAIFVNLEPSNDPTYAALQKVFAPELYSGPMSPNEKLAIANSFEEQGQWLEASKWLP